MLGETRYAAAFLILLTVLGPIFGVATGIVLLSPLGLNQTADPLRATAIAVTALLTSTNLTLSMRNYQVGKAASGAGGMTALGVFTSIFVGSCPICQPIWLFWLGLGSVSGILGAIGLMFGIASIAFLLWALKISLESGEKCEMKR